MISSIADLDMKTTFEQFDWQKCTFEEPIFLAYIFKIRSQFLHRF